MFPKGRDLRHLDRENRVITIFLNEIHLPENEIGVWNDQECICWVSKRQNARSGIKGTVLSTIEKSRKGVTIQEIKARTKLQERQVNNALYKLSKNGFVKAKTRGVYIIEESRYRA